MVTVEFLGPIAREPMHMEASSLQELAQKLQVYSDIAPWLEKCAVAINDEMVDDLSRRLDDGDKIVLLPPVCGG